MKLLYTIGIHLFSFGIVVAAVFNEKARLLKNGRRSAWEHLKKMTDKGAFVWIHCASLGEFEQGRPVIEAIKNKHPEKKILLSFFSPSGYEVRKDYEFADLVVYLPADTPLNAKRFVEAVKPESAIFVKYEFWPNYFKALNEKDVPLYSISSIFRENQMFFKWYGKWFRKTLQLVTKFYVQDETSFNLLNSIHIHNCVVAGDTRFDRVAAIVEASTEVSEAKAFAAPADLVLVAGSTWPPDEEILIRYINSAPEHVRLIIAPHEVHEAHIAQIEQKLKLPSFRYSEREKVNPEQFRVMIINTIGLLSAIYRYGHIAFIGGGFGKGIHNTLEAATYGIPVFFGPRYHKFKEARDLITCGGGFSVDNYESFQSLIEKFRTNKQECSSAGNASGKYVASMQGATELILKEVF